MSTQNDAYDLVNSLHSDNSNLYSDLMDYGQDDLLSWREQMGWDRLDEDEEINPREFDEFLVYILMSAGVTWNDAADHMDKLD